jgi:hypothetical protein
MATTEREITTADHILIDVHEILRRLTELETRLAKYEPLADAALRLQEGARMKLLGRGGSRHVRNGQHDNNATG